MENHKQKSRNIIIIIIVIILLLILILTGYIIYSKFSDKKLDKTNENVQKENISDENIEDQIKVKINQLINSGIYIDDNIKYSGSGLIFNSPKIVKNSDIPNNYKLLSAISYLNGLQDNSIETNKTNNTFKVQKKKIEENIKSVYGAYKNEKYSLNSCPKDIALNGNYYEGIWCNQEGVNRTDYYIYNISKKNDIYEVDIAVAYIEYIKDNNQITGIKIYKNLEKEEYSDKSERNNLLDETNYQEFSKYKITFVKNENGDYIFKESVRIEK